MEFAGKYIKDFFCMKVNIRMIKQMDLGGVYKQITAII